MASDLANDVVLRPEAVSRKSFGTSFRGYDQLEVRAYLGALAEELRALQERHEQIEARLQEAESRASRIVELDDTLLTRRLGEEAVQVLSSARAAAAQITAKAEANIARMLEEAQADAAKRRAQGEQELERARQEADDLRARAAADAAAEVDEARRRGRETVAEAQALRERVLEDLARRRRAVRLQWEQFQAGRQRLLDAYATVRTSLDDGVRELQTALPEARAAAEAAGRKVAGEPAPADSGAVEAELAEYLEREVVAPGRRRRSAEAQVGPSADVDLEGVQVHGEDAGGSSGAEAPPAEAGTDVAPAEEAQVEETAPAGEAESGAGEPVDAPTPPPSVDALFARIRADRAAAVAQAEAVLTADAAEVGATSGPAEEAAGPEPEVPAAPAEQGDDSALVARRDEHVAPFERLVARRLKRALDDEQNEVLDLLRRTGPGALAEALAGGERLDRLRDALTPPLTDAAVDGAHSVGGDLDAPSDAVVAAVETVIDDLAGPLGERLAGILAEAPDDDADALAERMRATYREWKTNRADEVASHAVLQAFGAGVYAAAPASALLRWVVDRGGAPCPDADDNALAGPVPKGEVFPTGHQHAPAHPGCRCLVAVEVR